MQMFFRVTAALGLGLILLAAGEAPAIDQFGLNETVPAVQPQAAAPLTPDTAATGPLMITGTESIGTEATGTETPGTETTAADTAVIEPFRQSAPASERPASLSAMVKQVRAAPAEMTDNLRCLATAVYWESKGEPLDGQLAVAQVILNRVEAGRFGPSICAVVKAPKQFSFVRSGSLPAPVNQEQWKVAQAIASIALADGWHAIVSDATHFHATRVNPNWRMRRVASVGNHIFYR